MGFLIKQSENELSLHQQKHVTITEQHILQFDLLVWLYLLRDFFGHKCLSVMRPSIYLKAIVQSRSISGTNQ